LRERGRGGFRERERMEGEIGRLGEREGIGRLGEGED
jgi:hypothetical protein